jgi:hypothetical protein
MVNRTITVPLDSQTAEVYDAAPAEERRKMEALLSLWLRDLTAGGERSLQQILDDVGRGAKAQGLTPEVLDSLLSLR